MKLRHGNMFTDLDSDVILATCNSYVKQDGRVVMGRGAAKTMRDMFPGCDQTFGSLILGLVYEPVCGQYGIVWQEQDYEPFDAPFIIGLFQVKDHWHEPAKLELIVSSVDILRKLAKNTWLDKAISLNFPGIGNGQLSRQDVLPLLHRLPDNVTIWEL